MNIIIVFNICMSVIISVLMAQVEQMPLNDVVLSVNGALCLLKVTSLGLMPTTCLPSSEQVILIKRFSPTLVYSEVIVISQLVALFICLPFVLNQYNIFGLMYD